MTNAASVLRRSRPPHRLRAPRDDEDEDQDEAASLSKDRHQHDTGNNRSWRPRGIAVAVAALFCVLSMVAAIAPRPRWGKNVVHKLLLFSPLVAGGGVTGGGRGGDQMMQEDKGAGIWSAASSLEAPALAGKDAGLGDFTGNALDQDVRNRVEGPDIIDSEGEDNQNDKAFLYYYAHWGFSNQLIELQHGAQLAWSLNRTLVLPPVLPWKKFGVMFPAWPGRGSKGRSCSLYELYDDHARRATVDANMARNNPHDSFPSFRELVDFDVISNELGIDFVDLHDFVRDEPHATFDVGEGAKLDLVVPGNCSNSTAPTESGENSANRKWDAVLDEFRSRFRTSGSVVPVPALGSVFKLFAFEDAHPISLSDKFDRMFFAFPLSEKLLRLVATIWNHLPSPRYVGIHLRTKDKMNLRDRCSNGNNVHNAGGEADDEVALMFQSVFNELIEKGVEPGTPILLAGNDGKHAQRCFNALAPNGTFVATTIDEVIHRGTDPALAEAVENQMVEIHTESSVVWLLLDQIFVSLGERIVLSRYHFNKDSTFHQMIQVRHRHRRDLLDRIQQLPSANHLSEDDQWRHDGDGASF